jgi:hypothetical protein
LDFELLKPKNGLSNLNVVSPIVTCFPASLQAKPIVLWLAHDCSSAKTNSEDWPFFYRKFVGFNVVNHCPNNVCWQNGVN